VGLGEGSKNMENNFVLLVNRADLGSNELEQFAKLLKREFSTVDYMRGFLDGFCFGKYTILNVAEFERKHNELMNTAGNYIFILRVQG
jgi:hypothetical protein